MSVVALVVIVFDKRAASTYVYRKKLMQGKESYLKLNKQIRLLIVL